MLSEGNTTEQTLGGFVSNSIDNTHLFEGTPDRTEGFNSITLLFTAEYAATIRVRQSTGTDVSNLIWDILSIYNYPSSDTPLGVGLNRTVSVKGNFFKIDIENIISYPNRIRLNTVKLTTADSSVSVTGPVNVFLSHVPTVSLTGFVSLTGPVSLGNFPTQAVNEPAPTESVNTVLRTAVYARQYGGGETIPSVLTEVHCTPPTQTNPCSMYVTPLSAPCFGNGKDALGSTVSTPISAYQKDGVSSLFTHDKEAVDVLNDIKLKNIQQYNTTNGFIGGAGEPLTGLNTYQILPKRKTFLFNAYSTNKNADAIVASNGNTQSFMDANWGLANVKTWYARCTGAPVTVNYTYIDATGNEQNSSVSLPVNGVTLMTTAVTINKWSASRSLTPGADALFLTTGDITKSYAGGTYRFTNNSLFTCPNNAIAWVGQVSFCVTSADNFKLLKWDANGVRSTLFCWYVTPSQTQTQTTGEYGFGGYITAGETIGWSSENASVGDRVNIIASNVTVHYF
jgi:hypothetical protein